MRKRILMEEDLIVKKEIMTMTKARWDHHLEEGLRVHLQDIVEEVDVEE